MAWDVLGKIAARVGLDPEAVTHGAEKLLADAKNLAGTAIEQGTPVAKRIAASLQSGASEASAVKSINPRVAAWVTKDVVPAVRQSFEEPQLQIYRGPFVDRVIEGMTSDANTFFVQHGRLPRAHELGALIATRTREVMRRNTWLSDAELRAKAQGEYAETSQQLAQRIANARADVVAHNASLIKATTEAVQELRTLTQSGVLDTCLARASLLRTLAPPQLEIPADLAWEVVAPSLAALQGDALLTRTSDYGRDLRDVVFIDAGSELIDYRMRATREAVLIVCDIIDVARRLPESTQRAAIIDRLGEALERAEFSLAVPDGSSIGFWRAYLRNRKLTPEAIVSVGLVFQLAGTTVVRSPTVDIAR